MANKTIKYLDPKNDLTFRKVFGEHPHLLIHFLNDLLPLAPEQKILDIEYLDNEIIPELPGFKRSVVDVRCRDNFDRYFIVEMQMYWTRSFKKRMLFNSGKAYVKQLKSGGKYRDLKPVYGLSLVDDIIHSKGSLKEVYYHHYKFIHTQDPEEQIDGLELIFIELPKFRATKFTSKRLCSLWLRFLTEIDENTKDIPEELKNDQYIKEAIECVQKDAFSEEELLYYEEYWDAIRTEKAALEEALERNQLLEKEREEERKQREEAEKQREEAQKQKEKERKQKEQYQKNLAKMMLGYGETVEKIIKETGLTKGEVERLRV